MIVTYDVFSEKTGTVSRHKSLEEALKAAKKKLKYDTATKSNIVKPEVIWLDDKNHTPIGLITIK